MIPFSPPKIYQEIIDEVVDTLKSGWITTGPKTKLFEKKLSAYTGAHATLCVSAATPGLELILQWFGVGEGDEVILPAYTYCATANVIMHCGAKPVFVDVGEDFNISVPEIRKAITKRTKVIMPVDFGGLPCDYDALNDLLKEEEIRELFEAGSENQQALGRILVLADSAHSIGAEYKGKKTGSVTDVAVFSFHAVKNLSTAEGGAVALHLPAPFDNESVYKELCIKSLHGQNKDALAKTQKGNWKYDIVEPGYKCNMTDIQASMGLVELKHYEQDTLQRRKAIFSQYDKAFSSREWAQLPLHTTEEKRSSYHLYALRIKGINEQQRDQIIQGIFDRDVSVNVHFQPVPMTSFYKGIGYRVEDYPVSYDNFSREISLPVYYDLSDDNIGVVTAAVISAVEQVVKRP